MGDCDKRDGKKRIPLNQAEGRISAEERERRDNEVTERRKKVAAKEKKRANNG